jgi:hypothetical protein
MGRNAGDDHFTVGIGQVTRSERKAKVAQIGISAWGRDVVGATTTSSYNRTATCSEIDR